MPVSLFSISEVYPPKLKTEEKRLHLTLEAVDLYNRAIQGAGLLVPDGALYLVDMHHLTQGGRHQALSEAHRLGGMVYFVPQSTVMLAQQAAGCIKKGTPVDDRERTVIAGMV